MMPAWRRLVLAAALGGILIGCAPKPMVQQKAPPPDPLLVTRKPVEGKPRADDTTEVRLLAPAPPGADGLASAPGDGATVRPVQLHVEPPRP